MSYISFDASPKQVSKLRNGHSVRIKRGTGFNVIVSPGTYNLVSKAFNKNRGIQLALSPDEIQMNRFMSPEQHAMFRETTGKGIFEDLRRAQSQIIDSVSSQRKKVLRDKARELMSGDGIMDSLKEAGKEFLMEQGKDLLKKAGKKAVEKGVDILQEKLRKKIMGGAMLKSGLVAPRADTLSQVADRVAMAEAMNNRIGTEANFDYMGRAGLGSAMANLKGAKLNDQTFLSRRGIDGMYKAPVIGGRINHMSISHPAITSQPNTANFQMFNMLPPAFQELKGSGLYAGRGLYA
jgi:hypothetical protein